VKEGAMDLGSLFGAFDGDEAVTEVRGKQIDGWRGKGLG